MNIKKYLDTYCQVKYKIFGAKLAKGQFDNKKGNYPVTDRNN